MPKFAISPNLRVMATMNISLPESLKEFVDERVVKGQYGTSSEYVRELIRRDQSRLGLENLLREGAASPISKISTPAFIASVRRDVSEAPRGKRRKKTSSS